MNQKSRRFTFSKPGDPLEIFPASWPLKTYNNTDYPGDDDHIAIGNRWAHHITESAPVKEARRASIKNWWLAKILNEGGIQEKMVMFWHNHFGVNIDPIYESHISMDYQAMIRYHALGNFKDLIKGVTLHPAMLIFLNGDGSKPENPNKNYARELSERFTMGINEKTEQEIKDDALLLSGFEVIKGTGEVIYTGNGQSPAMGLIDKLFEERAFTISHFICNKLVRYFIGEPNELFVSVLVSNFIACEWDLKPIINQILVTKEFENRPTQIKSPIDLLASVKRDFDIKLPEDPVILYKMMGQLRKKCAEMGMDLGEPPSVKGWDAYTQAPGYDTLWYQSDTAVLRAKFLESLFDPWTFQLDPPHAFWIDVLEFTKSVPYADDIEYLIPYVWYNIFGSTITTEMLATLKSILLSDQSENRYWFKAWNRYLSDPSERNTAVVKERLTALYKYMILLPEYQLQ
jgi:uncharacterized protein (DUF1800 family)